ncbi:Prophage minor tail protein Z (GPZ) [Paenibacillus sophorae]|uniref:Phage tail protein n=1 Tax=Paenibacillus sophorae TaxID=1333845 RepID=A0A1H8VSG1_9BACL|nr:phage tail protein [Paenibacillus sophorae]QWU15681.1 phage tail protein [Paenibacillus sophorae]SEP18244.1 Prophage minor tail protein Z (GPZ) [Paenibacillus sophorae]
MMNISGELRGAKDALRRVGRMDSDVRKAAYSALNRVSQRVKTESGRKVRETYIVKQKAVTGTAILRRGSMSNPGAELRWKGGNTPLIRFRTNPKSMDAKRPRVLRAAVKRAGGNKKVDGAFLARMGTGHVGVFRRTTRKRLPVEELYGPAVPVMLNNPEVVAHLERVAEEEFNKRLDHELNRRFGGGS